MHGYLMHILWKIASKFIHHKPKLIYFTKWIKTRFVFVKNCVPIGKHCTKIKIIYTCLSAALTNKSCQKN